MRSFHTLCLSQALARVVHTYAHTNLSRTHTHAHSGISHVLCVLFYASSRLRHRMRASLMTILLTVPPSLSHHCSFASIDSRDIPNVRICEFASHCFTLARNTKLLENACEKSRCFRVALLLKLHVTCIRLAYVGVCVCVCKLA